MNQSGNTTIALTDPDLSSYATQTWVNNQGFKKTDTTTTAGSSNSSSKLYLIGATSQSSSGVTTYSNSGVYGTAGSLYATAFYETSDANLKVFGDDIQVDFEKLKSIPKKYFSWKDGDGSLQLGTSAQAVREIYPELVTEDNILHLDYSKLSIIALAAIDKLYAENRFLESRIKELEQIIKHI
jgi:hypothetical protein